MGTFDKNADAVLNTTLAGSIDWKIEAIATIFYNVGLDRFGEKKKKRGKRERKKKRKGNSEDEARPLVASETVQEEKSTLSELRDSVREN